MGGAKRRGTKEERVEHAKILKLELTPIEGLNHLVQYEKDNSGLVYKVCNNQRNLLHFPQNRDGRYDFDLMTLMNSGNYRDFYVFSHPEMIRLENTFNYYIYEMAISADPHNIQRASLILNNVMSLAVKHFVMKDRAPAEEQEYYDIHNTDADHQEVEFVLSFHFHPLVAIAGEYTNEQLHGFFD